MAISSPGIGSNLDVNGIVSKLMQVESQPLTRLAAKEASYQAKLSAYGSLNSALASFQSTLASLADVSKFQSFSAIAGDSSIFTGSASSTAAAGSYTVNVTKLTQAHTLMASGQTSSTASIGNAADTLSFQFGTAGSPTSFGGPKTVSIAANSSLQNIADAVNSASIGVSATIVNDGSATPYRLVFTSTNPGAANSMSVTAAADATLQNLVSYDQVSVGGLQTMTQTAAAQNAELTVNNIAISSATNTVTGAISGVTLNLAKTGSTTLNVMRDTVTVQSAVQSFVKAFNDVNKTFKDLASYDPKTKVGGPLLGDSAVLSVQSQIRRVLSSPLVGQSGNITSLSQVGVSFQKDGTLALDSTKLSSAISTNFSDIAGLFAAAGKITDSLVSFSGSTDNTQPGNYELYVNTMASRGDSLGNVDLNLGNTTIASGTTMNMTLDGVSASVALVAGSYTASQFAAMIQTAINGTSAFSSGGSSVVASVNATTGFLNVTSNRYGSASNVTMNDGTGTTVSTFMGTATGTSGVDVAGTINGTAASGSGQYMTSADGLKIQVTGGVTGARGSVSFSRGYAYQLNKLVSGFLATPGLLSGRTDGINRSIEDIGKQRDALALRLTATEARYRAQFTQLDTLISSMTQTSNFLTQQLATLPKNS